MHCLFGKKQERRSKQNIGFVEAKVDHHWNLQYHHGIRCQENPQVIDQNLQKYGAVNGSTRDLCQLYFHHSAFQIFAIEYEKFLPPKIVNCNKKITSSIILSILRVSSI